MPQVPSSTKDLLPKDLKFEHGGAKSVSCPGRHLTSLCPLGWDNQIHSEYLHTQSLVSLIKSISNFGINNPSNLLKSTPNAVGLAMDLLLSRRANTGDDQPITKLNPWISASTTSTIENVKICTVFLFLCSNLWDLHGMI